MDASNALLHDKIIFHTAIHLVCFFATQSDMKAPPRIWEEAGEDLRPVSWEGDFSPEVVQALHVQQAFYHQNHFEPDYVTKVKCTRRERNLQTTA